MVRLEDLTQGTRVRGLTPDGVAREMITASRMSNPFDDKNLLIARLDQLSRNEEIQQRLQAAREWDLRDYDFGQRGFAQTSATYPLNSLTREGSRPT